METNEMCGSYNHYNITRIMTTNGWQIYQTTSSTGEISMSAVPYSTESWNNSYRNWDTLIEKMIRKEDMPEMKVNVERIPHTNSQKYKVMSTDANDFSLDRVLKTLSIMKSRLMMECAPVQLKDIACSMTPAVKENLISAWRKVNMYGKKIPFVPCFDEYGNRLEDKVRIETLDGIKVKIINPDDVGPYYLSFEGVLTDLFDKNKKDNKPIDYSIQV